MESNDVLDGEGALVNRSFEIGDIVQNDKRSGIVFQKETWPWSGEERVSFWGMAEDNVADLTAVLGAEQVDVTRNIGATTKEQALDLSYHRENEQYKDFGSHLEAIAAYLDAKLANHPDKDAVVAHWLHKITQINPNLVSAHVDQPEALLDDEPEEASTFTPH